MDNNYILNLKNNYKFFDIVLNDKNIKYNNNIYIQYNILHKKMKRLRLKNNQCLKLFKISKQINSNSFGNMNFIHKKFNIYEYYYYNIKEPINFKNYYISDKNEKIIEKKQYKNMFLVIKNPEYLDKNLCERELYLHRIILIFLYNLYSILEKNGNIYISIPNYSSYKTIFIILFLLNFFKKQTIIYGSKLYCFGFKKDITHKKMIKNILKNNINFSIKNNITKKFKKIYDYINFIYKIKIERTIYIITKDEYRLIRLVSNYNIKTIIESGLFNQLNENEFNLLMLYIYKNKDIQYNVTNICNLIIRNKYKKILEIGSSNGIIPYNILKNNININITSLYNNSDNLNYKLIDNISNIYTKSYNVIYSDNITNLLFEYKKYKQKFDIILINYDNIDICLFNYYKFLLKKNSIIIINNNNNDNNDNNYLINKKKDYNFLKKIDLDDSSFTYYEKK
jgi:hypothetical protein